MTLEERITVLTNLGALISANSDPQIDAVINKSIIDNPWFTKEGIKLALDTIATEYLDEEKLYKWTDAYTFPGDDPKTVGLVLAGNIPLVGFHDVLSVFISGHRNLIKLSQKDSVLMKWLIEKMIEIDFRCADFFKFAEQLKTMDAVIATGGEVAATHFKYYFSKYPHIIRKNRSSIAVLDGSEDQQTLRLLGEDVFTYFGLGCRNVSKIYVPAGFELNKIFESFVDFSYVIDHNKYKNNFDYSYAIYLLGKEPFLTNNFLILREDKTLGSRISCLHYEYYDDPSRLQEELQNHEEHIQCIASRIPFDNLQTIDFGMCQKPSLNDYADRVDTLKFLLSL